MRLLRIHSATLIRQEVGEGYWDDRGNWLEREEKSQTEIRCCVQPKFSGSEYQKVLPSGVTKKDCREILSYTELKTGDEYTQTVADLILFQNELYEIFEVNEWQSPTYYMSHYKALMVRKDKLQEVITDKHGDSDWRDLR